MALFHVMALDKSNALDLRLENRAAHLEWAKAAGDTVRMAGPLLADDGESFVGSVFLIEAESEEALKAFQAEDPYIKAGLFQTVDIRPFKLVISN
ncbi:YciI family protein [Ponticaulis sp.]|uniref:YciI family protein n=1 Tax=Ponticaulis sp. TaxID=2020902 RepID=UPI0026326AE1|nr:YciI family protein [Ponticaulis sp.]MDF1679852.1 YciI family protein [Ponticaulis sp.]